MKDIEIEFDRGEMIAAMPERVDAKNIGPGGALGLWDGFGRLIVRVNGEEVALFHVHRDAKNKPVLDVVARGDYTIHPDLPGFRHKI